MMVYHKREERRRGEKRVEGREEKDFFDMAKVTEYIWGQLPGGQNQGNTEVYLTSSSLYLLFLFSSSFSLFFLLLLFPFFAFSCLLCFIMRDGATP